MTEHIMTEHIEPCPFCGGTGGWEDSPESWRWMVWHCAGCDACGPLVRFHAEPIWPAEKEEARRMVLAAWNKRLLVRRHNGERRDKTLAYLVQPRTKADLLAWGGVAAVHAAWYLRKCGLAECERAAKHVYIWRAKATAPATGGGE